MSKKLIDVAPEGQAHLLWFLDDIYLVDPDVAKAVTMLIEHERRHSEVALRYMMNQAGDYSINEALMRPKRKRRKDKRWSSHSSKRSGRR